jgi:transglutaminase-like putative cysteine protease
MKKKILFISIFFAAICSSIFAQNYAVDNIPDELKKNSNAVIRYSSTEFIYSDIKSATEKHVFVITVLNKQGDGLSNFICYGDKFRTLKSFLGEIFDKDGKSMRKIKKSEITESEYTDASTLASDVKYYYLSPKTSYYPYTIRYEYEIGWKNGILSFPAFVPVSDYDVSLETATYTLSLPKGCEYLSKNLNTDIKPVGKNAGNFDVYEWSLNNFAAIKSESFSPKLREIFPMVYLTPSNFYYDNTNGNQRGWDNYGKWQWRLLQGRDLLPAPLKQEIHNLTDGLTTREKVKVLYDYLGKHTRYVSIQLGIGGLQPIAAEDVYKSKFGDCKALSNFMKAMLRECGIDAFYTEISMTNQKIYDDYASALQTNHVILQVPLENETIWLECTNPEIPFGYVHDGIAGHNALVYKAGTIEFVTLPQNPDSLNLMTQNITVNIAEDGYADVHVAKRYELEQYEIIAGIKYLDEKEKLNWLQKMVRLPLATIKNIKTEEYKNSVPVMTLDFDVDVNKYGSVSGSRFFVPVNPFNKNAHKLDKERNLDISITRGYHDIDTITLNFPSDLTVESKPSSTKLKTDIGEYSFDIKHEAGKITIVQTFLMHSGNYPKEKYEEFSTFMKSLEKLENAKIVLKKN